MKRSTCASGSGYVPSDSIGFCVAITRNGDGTGCVAWPIVTWRSCMTSSSADCTLAGARLISSASRKLQNTGPSSVSKPPVSGRKTRVPMRSAGTRSGVNCRRLNVPPSASATVLTVSVFASPGTPSSSTWPPATPRRAGVRPRVSWRDLLRALAEPHGDRPLLAAVVDDDLDALAGPLAQHGDAEVTGILQLLAVEAQ